MIALVGEYKNAGRLIGLNMVGNSQLLPLGSATENHRAGNNPFNWKSFSGKSRIADAWQLVRSYRQIRSLSQRTIWVGILDSGFWLDGAGFAYAAPGQIASDLGTRPLQLNLLDESAPAGGASGIPTGIITKPPGMAMPLQAPQQQPSGILQELQALVVR